MYSVKCYVYFRSNIDCNTGVCYVVQHLNITFRRDPTNYWPRINKLDSTKDTEQKGAGSYYYLDD